MLARARHLEFAPPDKLNDSPSKMPVFAVVRRVRPRPRPWRHQVLWRCYHVHVSFLPLGGRRTDPILQSLHHHPGAEAIQSVRCRRRRRHPRLGLADRSHTHSLLLLLLLRGVGVMAKNGNLRVGRVAAACQAGDGTAQRGAEEGPSGAEGQARGGGGGGGG